MQFDAIIFRFIKTTNQTSSFTAKVDISYIKNKVP
jgi:hypothetical protein